MNDSKGPQSRKVNYFNQYKQVINGIKLEIAANNGCLQTPLAKNMHMISSDEIAYLSGSHIVICDLSSQKQSFIEREVTEQPTTAFSYCIKSDQIYFAIASQSTDMICPTVKIYKDDRDRKKGEKKSVPKLDHTHLGFSSVILDMQFINNGKFIATLGVTNDTKFIVSFFGMGKKNLLVTKTLETPYERILYSNQAQEYFILVGSKHIIQFRYIEEESNFETQELDLSFLENMEYIMDAAYMIEKERLGVVTNKNHCIYLKENKFVTKFQLNPNIQQIQKIKSNYYTDMPGLGEDKLSSIQPSAQSFQCTCITGMLQGFSVGFGGHDNILLLEIFGDQKIVCRPGHMHRIGQPHFFKTLNVTCSDDESYLAVAVQHSNKNIKQIIKSEKDMHDFEEDMVKEHISEDYQQKKNSDPDFYKQNEEKTKRKSKMHIVKSMVKAAHAFGGIKAHYDNTPNQMLGKIDIYIYDLQLGEIQQIDKPMEKLFGDGSQKGIIQDIAVCPSSSKVITISEDKILKLWGLDIKKSKQLSVQQVESFPENPLSVALHPMSFQVALGCKECLKVYFPQEDEFKLVFYDTLKSATKVQYSSSGNFLACSNANSIHVYNPYNFQLIHVFASCHSGTVTGLQWSDDFSTRNQLGVNELIYQDLYLISSCSGGVVIKWNIATGERKYEHYNGNKQSKIQCAIYDPDIDICLDCQGDGKLKFWGEKGYTLLFDHNVYPMSFTCAKLFKSDYQPANGLSQNIKIAIFGTSQGTIRCYNWPFDPKASKYEFFEIPCHDGPVTCLNWTYDYSYLITGGEDGQIKFLKMIEIQENHVQQNKFLQFETFLQHPESLDSQKQTELNMYYMNKLCFTSKFTIEAKNESIKELEFRLSNLQSDLDDEKEKQEQIKQKNIESLKSNNIQMQKEHKEQSAIQLEDCDTKYRELSAKRAQNEFSYKKTKEQMILVLEQSLLNLYKESDTLKEFKKEVEGEVICEQKETVDMFERQLQSQEQEYIYKLKEMTSKLEQSKENQALDLKKYEEVRRQNKEEYEEFLQKMEKNYKLELENSQKQSEELRTSYSKHQKLCEKYKLRILELEQLINETKTQIKHLEEEQQVFKKKQEAMDQQLQTKELIINHKENELKDFRSKNKHLKNFQNVYDYKVTSLQEERQPLIEHLGVIETNIKQMYRELLDEANSQKQIDDKLGDSKKLAKDLKNKIKQKNEFVLISQRKVDAFQYDIASMIKNNQFNEWIQKMKEIYSNSFEGKASIQNLLRKTKIDLEGKDFKVKNGEEQGISEELVRQRDFMSKKISTISRLNKQSENDRDDIVVRVQNENTHLIRECNTLREERKSLQEQLGQFESALELITKELTRLAYFEEERQDDELQEQRELGGGRYNYDILDIEEQKIPRRNIQGKTAFERYKDDQNNGEKSSKKRVGGMSLQLGGKMTSLFDDSIKKDQYNNVSKSISGGLGGKSTQINNSITGASVLQNSSITHSQNEQLISTLLKDIDNYSRDNANQDYVYEKLKEKVTNFLYKTNEENSITLPQISRVDKTMMASQEETMIQNQQASQISDYSSINVTQLENNKIKSIHEQQLSHKKVQKSNYKFMQKEQRSSKSVSTLPILQQHQGLQGIQNKK